MRSIGEIEVSGVALGKHCASDEGCNQTLHRLLCNADSLTSLNITVTASLRKGLQPNVWGPHAFPHNCSAQSKHCLVSTSVALLHVE